MGSLRLRIQGTRRTARGACWLPLAMAFLPGCITLGVDERTKKALDELSVAVNALAAIDPLGLNKVLAENKQLRDDLGAANLRLQGTIGNHGVIALKDNRLLLRVRVIQGTVTMAVGIATSEKDAAANEVVRKHLVGDIDGGPTPSKLVEAIKASCKSNIASLMPGSYWEPYGDGKKIAPVNGFCDGAWYDFHGWGGWIVNQVWPDAANAVWGRAAEQWKEYLAGNPIRQGTTLSEIDLQEQLNDLGKRFIVISATPQKLGVTGEWLAEARLIIVPAAGGPERTLQEHELRGTNLHSAKISMSVVTAPE